MNRKNIHKRFCAVFRKIRFWLICTQIFFLQASLAFGVDAGLSFPVYTQEMTTPQQFEEYVKEFIGIPYRWGGTTRKGLDCSGFVRLVYDQIFGIELPHSSTAQFRDSDLISIDRDELQPGDLIFFNSRGRNRINHVGVYLSDNQFIHASTSAGITVSSLDSRYWRNRIAGTRRHEEVDTVFENTRLRLDASLEIALDDQSSILAHSTEEFDIHSVTPEMENPAFQPRKKKSEKISAHEISYAYNLSDGLDIRLATLVESFRADGTWPEIESVFTKLKDGDIPSYDRGDRRGFKVASKLQPIRNLSIIPSVTFYDYSEADKEIINTPDWQYGLNTVFASLNNPFSMAFMLKHAEKETLSDPTTPYNHYSSLGLSLQMGFRVTKDIQLSITGEHENKEFAYDKKGATINMETDASNVFMSLDFKY